jgi:hypothetical protein
MEIAMVAQKMTFANPQTFDGKLNVFRDSKFCFVIDAYFGGHYPLMGYPSPSL